MTYVGAKPTTGDFKLLDSITTSSTTTFNLRQGGVAVYPQSANHCIVSLNGVIQAPSSAFTIANDTIVFASSLTSSDVINFILVLGNVNDIGVPSSGSVGLSQLSASGTKDATTFLRGDNTFAVAKYIDWQTSSIKTSTFTAEAGKGYFVNTTGGAVTVNLPAGVAGSQIAVVDYARTFASNNLTIASNGSEKIQGSVSNSELKTAGGSAVLTYVDSTKGWIYTEQDNVSSLEAPAYVTATGGTVTTSGDYKIHTFLSSSTFNVSNAGNSAGSDEVEVLVVGGGGSGGGDVGAGGGGGGVVNGTITATLTATNYTITVGAGGAGTSGAGGNNGNDSYFAQGAGSGLECKGAGGGRGGDEGTANGSAGGSGGGAFGSGSAGASSGNTAAAGTTGYGNAGGTGTSDLGGGGGGANGTGGSVSSGSTGGAGGAGKQINIDGNNYYWAGGGGGAAWMNGTGGAGGTGGGGGGTSYYTSCSGGSGGSGGGSAINSGGAGHGDDDVQSGSGGANSGGGGGGAGNYWGSCSQQAGNGGSGIVIVKYKYQN